MLAAASAEQHTHPEFLHDGSVNAKAVARVSCRDALPLISSLQSFLDPANTNRLRETQTSSHPLRPVANTLRQLKTHPVQSSSSASAARSHESHKTPKAQGTKKNAQPHCAVLSRTSAHRAHRYRQIASSANSRVAAPLKSPAIAARDETSPSAQGQCRSPRRRCAAGRARYSHPAEKTMPPSLAHRRCPAATHPRERSRCACRSPAGPLCTRLSCLQSGVRSRSPRERRQRANASG